VNWDDFDALSSVTPLIARIYPNGQADINHFQAAGGMAYLFKELLAAGLLHNDVKTICGEGLDKYTKEPKIVDGELVWVDGPSQSLDADVLATADNPFKPDGGLSVLSGNLGRAVIKTSSIREGKSVVKAPAVVFESQHDIEPAFKAGLLDKDCVVVVRYQGPRAVGMPELHKLTPPLSVLQDKGYSVALVTDGRMSGASGKVPAAIHLYPEALDGGLIAKVQDGDIIEVNADKNLVKLYVSDEELAKREVKVKDLAEEREGMGREMFNGLRRILTTPEEGAACVFHDA
jgi:phosphogluconate dehydratase